MTDNSSNKSLKILVVEDSRTQAKFLRFILEEEGCRVLITDNGSEALMEVGSFMPDAILTDIVMPEMNGYELCSKIKTSEETAHIPVILVTQLFDAEDLIKGLEAGADYFIIKPYQKEDIQKLIIDILPDIISNNENKTINPFNFSYLGKNYKINSGKNEILNILLTTYSVAVKKNSEIEEAHDRLNSLNEELKKAFSDQISLNENLSAENKERKRVENALAEANKKLQLMASITRHDLLNQLTALQGYLEITNMLWDEEPETARKNLEKAFGMITKTKNTIEFTKDYQEIGQYSPKWHSLHTLVGNSLNHINVGDIRFENDISHDIDIYADSLIEKVFSNLVDNAVRYGDKITYIRFRSEKRDGNCCIYCEDDGVGIKDNDKEKIFSYEYGMNTGFGLFLSREILGITGIKISETGKRGEGARFELLVPENSIRNSDNSQ
ncbi:hybrid sensor histidine kinase/response regulator [Methanomicrobium antiquum]|uniref:Hybrid sensor histidine kinase/response regulator n=1 Tax=Methanomicrobium antiquum TaxID=487686 RepID=A0AAF0JME6_9EURY|nr:hybrid sensor histidine kinase/response regulator [Methanomicrobium antiquum]WFN37779.1 hybrid sensor histidine kinase/response regulator [Methanomicrobium antiquum]